MLLTILALGGAILGATTIAGILMLYQIRATTDAENSAKAIFAADAGTQWTLFDYYCDVTTTYNPFSRCVPSTGLPDSPREQNMPWGTVASSTHGVATLPNGAIMEATCYDAATPAPNAVSCSSSSAVTAVDRGTSLTSERVFLVNIAGGTSTAP